MKQVRARYSKEFKVKAVELVQAKGNVRLVAEELNVNAETLRLWIKAFKKGKLTSSQSLGEKQKSKEELEIARLSGDLLIKTKGLNPFLSGQSLFAVRGVNVPPSCSYLIFSFFPLIIVYWENGGVTLFPRFPSPKVSNFFAI